MGKWQKKGVNLASSVMADYSTSHLLPKYTRLKTSDLAYLRTCFQQHTGKQDLHENID